MENKFTPEGAQNFVAPRPEITPTVPAALPNEGVLFAGQEVALPQPGSIDHPVTQVMIQQEARRNVRKMLGGRKS